MLNLFERPRRNRDREGAGKSDASWKKHDLIKRLASGQAKAFRTKRSGRILIIDMHAGDGVGVDELQLDLFGGNPSCATAELALRLAADVGNADVVLCEKDRNKRALLEEQFPDAKIIGDHARAAELIRNDHVWSLVINDPNGYSKHGIEHMRTIARRVPSDFIIIFNEGALKRLLGMNDDAVYDNAFPESVRQKKVEYEWMMQPVEWMQRIGRRRMVRSEKLIKASSNFHYRVMLVADYLTDAAKRRPFEEVK